MVVVEGSGSRKNLGQNLVAVHRSAGGPEMAGQMLGRRAVDGDGGQLLPVLCGFTQVHAVLPRALSVQPAASSQRDGYSTLVYCLLMALDALIKSVVVL